MGPLPKLPPSRALLDTPTAEERQISSSCLPFKCDVTAFHYQNLPCCRCPGNSSPCTLCPQHKEYHRHGQGSPSGTVIHILSGLPRGRCLEPSSPESPQDGESANTPLRASVTESPSSRSDPPAALSVRGLAWGGGGGEQGSWN